MNEWNGDEGKPITIEEKIRKILIIIFINCITFFNCNSEISSSGQGRKEIAEITPFISFSLIASF